MVENCAGSKMVVGVQTEGDRNSMRHLLEPPIDCRFGNTSALLTDISVSGARLCHWSGLEGGAKSHLELDLGGGKAVAFEAMVVWSHSVSNQICGDYTSGLKMIADPASIGELIEEMVSRGLTRRIAENRRSNRFLLNRSLDGRVEDTDVRICDLSSTGARIESSQKFQTGERFGFTFELPRSDFVIALAVEVVWSYLTAVWSESENRYSSGLRAVENPGMMRAAIGHLSDLRLAEKDVRSLALKNRLVNYEIGHTEAADGVDLESGGRISLVRNVRSALAKEDAQTSRWFDRARVVAEQADIRGVAGPIASDIEALAVWEFLDRSIDPSLVALGFSG